MGTERSTVLEPSWQGLPALDTADLAGSASCALPPKFEAVRTAREFTRRTLLRWNLDTDLDNVAVVVSELVTNALRHGLPAGCPQEPETPVRLHLMRWSARLVCAVRDPSPESPNPPVLEGDCADFEAESGRGLQLVGSFSDGWGWHPMSGSLPGKVVWALFRLSP